jgi:polysaccharide biosynthesis protein PslJ
MLLSHIRSLWTRIPATVLACALFGLAAGYLAVSQPKLAVALLGLGVILALMARSPVSVALLVAPASFNVSRLSVGHGIALPDLLLIIATLLSFPAMARLGTPRGVTNVRRWFAVYAVAMLVIVVLHPSGRALEEAIHRTLLVAGALSVGAWIYLEGKSRLALRILVGVAVFAGVLCILAGAAHGFRQPAQPVGLNKNYAGAVLGLTLLVVLAAPGELELSPMWRYFTFVALGGGLAATHSRAAMLGFVVGVFVWFFRTHSDYRRRSFIIAAVLGLGFLALSGYLIKSQLSDKVASQNTNSVAVRTKTDDATIALWRTSPIVGVGIYYYNNPYYQEINPFLVAPTNAVVEALAEGGIVLAAGFIIFNVGSIAVLLRYRNPLAVAGLAMVADRLAHGMVDIFWTAGDSSLPWIIVGMGLAQAAVTRRNAIAEAAGIDVVASLPLESV